MSRQSSINSEFGTPPSSEEYRFRTCYRTAPINLQNASSPSPHTANDNGNVHRAAAKDMQAEKTARPAAPCATYCYHAFFILTLFFVFEFFECLGENLYRLSPVVAREVAMGFFRASLQDCIEFGNARFCSGIQHCK